MAKRDEALLLARASLSNGHVDAAARECARLLLANPTDLEARYLQGRCRAALGRWSDATADFRRVLAVLPAYYPALVDIGIAQAFAGEYRDASRALRSAEAIDPRPAELHFGLGMCALGMGDLTAAEAGFRAALARNPRLTDAHNNLGVVYDRQGRLEDAIVCFRTAAAMQPEHVMSHQNLAEALLRAGDADGAATAYGQVVQRAPMNPLGYAGLGAALLSAGDFAGAMAPLSRALELDPGAFDAAANLGEALRNAQDLDGAERAFERCLSIRAETPEAHLGIGRVRMTQGRAAEARTSFLTAARLKHDDAATLAAIVRLLDEAGGREEAMTLLQESLVEHPVSADLYDAHGDLLARRASWREAAAAFERALAFEPNRPQTLLSLGGALESAGAIQEALDHIQKSLVLRPGHAAATAALASCAFRVCDWDLAEDSIARLRALPGGTNALHPFVLLASDLEPGEQAAALRQRAQAFSVVGTPARPRRRFGHDRLRLAYVSPDFRDHPVAHALAGVIEHHDRKRFSPIGISLAAGDDSAVGRRLRSTFDEFVDASALSVGELAVRLADREIDIVVDLAGHTAGAQPSLFALQPGSIQVNYLGFPGSMGGNFMDFIVADETVIAPADELLYSERVLRMPNSYLPFDSRSPVGRIPSRAAVGLPDRGLVFCAFTTPYKIARGMFDTWMSLLRDVPESVLWLRQSDAATAGRLRAAAAAHAVTAERLIFAPLLQSRVEHLARLGCADLFLDTLPYNAHTTATEALWAGVPVLTCPGRSFAGRVGASVLRAAGLDELICESVEHYRERALALARAPGTLQALRERLAQQRRSSPLFDTARYTRDLEALLEAAWRMDPRP